MESQQDQSEIVDMVYLDHAFRHFPDQEIAATIRRQILLGCKVVEEKKGEVSALQDEVQALKGSLEAKMAELEVHEEALKNEKAKHEDQQRELADELAKFNDLTKDFPSKVENFTKGTDEGFKTLKSSASDVADKIEAYVKATSEKEEADRTLSQGIHSKLRDMSASTEKSKSDLSILVGNSAKIVTAIESLKEDQKRNATVQYLDTKFALVGGLAQRLQTAHARVNELVQENQTLKNENGNLTSERDNAQEVASRAEIAFAKSDQLVQEKDSKLEALQTDRDGLRDRLTAANSQIFQGQEASRELDRVQCLLQTAEAGCRELASVKTRLQRAEQTAREMKQNIDHLQRSLDGEKGLHNDCSAKLTQALSNNSESLRQEAKLKDECAELRKELTVLRSQETLDLQQQMKNQWATVEEALKGQLSDSLSHERTIERLNTAWDSERKLQQAEIQRQNNELDTLQSRVSELEPLGEQLRQACSEAEDVQRKLTASESKANQFEENYGEAKTTIDDLRGEIQVLEHQAEDSTVKIKSLEEKLNAVEHELSSQQSHQCVTMPQGVLGDLAKIYLRLADVFSDIPVVPETEEGLDMAIIAVDMANLLDEPEAKDNLTTFLNSDLQGWHCLRQVIDGEPDSEVESGDISCDYHKDHGRICTMVRVVQWDSPRLEFHQTR
ncbi:uncharacterized protein FFUJ_09026 [Fusarium fujikuroi IMI 58289]|uniref:Uncharacterized protein n=1 Tax=Gibberella fujikuroi (strain CBS 195.34 / IMI 58289 / NRRL A-6831) TaxID=1279085 RepID=S0EB05_GIBF5|nr:uncharacterized protein FFUJ_09026 [Fusarium fujikuroi IMI 58289]KLP18836.1 uncharacterized protein LW94_1916 [Fusarium fujikuroi]QGI83904.1 hypothetical protein CEK25_010633 [Fusarium fujikuroi]QGI97556.1 hypothetical protein CEK26_010625 [Fusarium fujikuroi]CCT70947.1 uncharacterized protein FFUJ_09026 [Fusarium fujikuroi IMI 58289]SCO02621.1 uncharacterized protein FFM5_07908 [Fusarium fujikuroi]